jgi:hypothetical protein
VRRLETEKQIKERTKEAIKELLLKFYPHTITPAEEKQLMELLNEAGYLAGEKTDIPCPRLLCHNKKLFRSVFSSKLVCCGEDKGCGSTF